jgi:hypothetical protein
MVTDLPVDFVTQAPLISNEKVLELLLQNFGIKSASITPLSGYDDLNFRLENVTYLNDEKYGQTLICKFTNPIEARYPDLLGRLTFYFMYICEFRLTSQFNGAFKR